MYGPNPYYGSPYAGYYGSPYAGYYTPPYTDSNTTPYTGSYTPPIINFSGAYGANAYGQTSSVSWGNYSFPFESNYNNNTNAYMPYGLYPNYSYGPTSVSTNQNSPKKKTSNNKSKVKTYQGTRKPKAKVTNEPEKKDTTYVITAQDSTTGGKFSIKGNAEDITFKENGEIEEFKIIQKMTELKINIHLLIVTKKMMDNLQQTILSV